MPVETGARIHHIAAGGWSPGNRPQIRGRVAAAVQVGQIEVSKCRHRATIAIEFQSGELTAQARELNQVAMGKDLADQTAIFQVVTRQRQLVVPEQLADPRATLIDLIDGFPPPQQTARHKLQAETIKLPGG